MSSSAPIPVADLKEYFVADSPIAEGKFIGMNPDEMLTNNIKECDPVLLKSADGKIFVGIAKSHKSCNRDQIYLTQLPRQKLGAVVMKDRITLQKCEDIVEGKEIHLALIGTNWQGFTFQDIRKKFIYPYFTKKCTPISVGDIILLSDGINEIEFKVCGTDPAPYCLVTVFTAVKFEMK